MNTKKILLAGIAGGIVYFLLGWLLYGMLLTDFMKSHAGSATGVMRASADMILWSLILGNLVSGILLSTIFVRWANIRTAGSGFSGGATVGFLFAASFDLVMYGTSNLSDLTGMVVDVLVFTVMSAIAGAVVGAVAGMGGSKAAS